MTATEQIKTALKTLVADARYLKSQMDEFSEWNSLGKMKANFSRLTDFVGRVVIFAELAASKIKGEVASLQSKDKRDAVVSYLDDLIVLPWFLEPLDGPVISALVDFVVGKLNDRLGHDWGLAKIEALADSGGDVLDIAGSLPWEKKGERE